MQKLVLLEKKSKFQHVAVRCICTLLEAVPHFNFRESLLAAVVKNIGSQDDVIRFHNVLISFIIVLSESSLYYNAGPLK